jgi:post-segregation antitoxin (ccd killing protein)
MAGYIAVGTAHPRPNRGGMYRHVYLPDELAQRAKDAGLNLSGLLREAVERQLRVDEERVRVEQGVHRIGQTVVLIELNTAHRARRNGVELVPADLLPQEHRRSLRVSVEALRRWLAALE